jgi:hypothetical protein
MVKCSHGLVRGPDGNWIGCPNEATLFYMHNYGKMNPSDKDITRIYSSFCGEHRTWKAGQEITREDFIIGSVMTS